MSEHDQLIVLLREIRDALRGQGGRPSAGGLATRDSIETLSVNEAARKLHTRAAAVERLIAQRRLVCVNLGERRIPLWSIVALQESGATLEEAG